LSLNKFKNPSRLKQFNFKYAQTGSHYDEKTDFNFESFDNPVINEFI